MDTIEKRLKDYKGYQMWKVTDMIEGKIFNITYMINDNDGNNLQCLGDLNKLKRWADKRL